MLRILPLALVLSWDPSPGASGYRVFYGSATGVYLNATNVASTSVTLPVQSGYFRVGATNQWGEGLSAELYVPPVPTLTIRTILESADSVTGPWKQEVTNSAVFTIVSNKFYRARMEQTR